MAIELIDKIAPKNDGFTGMVDADQVIGGVGNTLPDAAVAASNVTQHVTTNATHTGEVTGSSALTIANNVVDEANLKLDTSPTNDYVLTADSTASGGMKWAAVSSGFADPMTTRGDIIYRNSSGTTTRLPAGTNGQALMSDGTDIAWATPSGSGNVSNTGTPVNNQLAVWTDATTIEGVTGLTYDGSTFTVGGITNLNGNVTIGDSTYSLFWNELNGQLTYTGLKNGNSLLLQGVEGTGLVNSPYWAMRCFNNSDPKDMNFRVVRQDATVYYFEVSDYAGDPQFTVDYLGNTETQGNLTVNGNISVTGNVDGVDIAAEQTRLANTSGTNTGDQDLSIAAGITGQFQINDGSDDFTGANFYYVSSLAELEAALGDSSHNTKIIYINAPVEISSAKTLQVYKYNNIISNGYLELSADVTFVRHTSQTTGSAAVHIDYLFSMDDTTFTIESGSYTRVYLYALGRSEDGTDAPDVTLQTESGGTYAHMTYQRAWEWTITEGGDTVQNPFRPFEPFSSSYTITSAIEEGTTTPTSMPSKAGDLYIDTSNNLIYTATGSSSSSDWTHVLSNISEDTTPQLGGELDLNGNGISHAGDVDLVIKSTTATTGGSKLSLFDSTEVAGGGIEYVPGDNRVSFFTRFITDSNAIDISTGTNAIQINGATTIGTVLANKDLTVNGDIAVTGTVDGVDIASRDHDAVTLDASATTGGMSLSGQAISNRAATNAQTGYATAAHITAIEANTAKTGVTTQISNVVEDTTPDLGGDLNWNSNGIKLTGQTVAGSNGNLVYLSSANTWTVADADAASSCSGMLGIRISATEVLTQGVYTTTGLTAASTYYASTTAGGITTTAPSATGDIVRIIGYALSTTEFYFYPDKSYIELA